ncbi:MAG: CDP-alcohol phosphatidyltransferase family protein [Chromatiales bacterium]|nr:CDP-alcohol phosphatidyltransferase family protein [Chromatiales bacterium]
MSNHAPPHLFPLVRHASYSITPLLARTGLNPNQVTALSLVCGLGAAWCVALGAWHTDIAGGLAFSLCYVLDNCDGELARLTNASTRFGIAFDTTVDWLVHTALFLGIGYGATVSSGNEWW